MGDVTTCPRCGYDQTGVIDAWQDACPLQGTCPECGLAFAWHDLIRGQLHAPRELVEHCRSWMIPLAAIGSLVASALPWWLWRRLKLMHDVRGVRLAMLVLCALIVMLAVLIWVHEANAIWRRRPAMLLYDLYDQTLPNIAQDAVCVLNGGHGARITSVFYVDIRPTDATVFATAMFVASFATTLAFIALPIARARAKVLWSHVLRCGAYAFASSAVVSAALWWLHDIPSHRRLFGPAADLAGDRTAWIVMFAWFSLWWCVAASRYLRMDRPFAVGVSVSALGTTLAMSYFIAVTLLSSPV